MRSAALLGFSPWAVSQVSGIPSPSVSKPAGLVTTVMAGWPPTTVSLAMTAPKVPSDYLIYIRVSTGSRTTRPAARNHFGVSHGCAVGGHGNRRVVIWRRLTMSALRKSRREVMATPLSVPSVFMSFKLPD